LVGRSGELSLKRQRLLVRKQPSVDALFLVPYFLAGSRLLKFGTGKAENEVTSPNWAGLIDLISSMRSFITFSSCSPSTCLTLSSVLSDLGNVP
jgi:hypothetical protein